jgi:hypothetical protein
MPEGKSLKFQFGLDQSSFDRVKRAMDEIIAKGKELSKVMQGAGGSSGGGGLLSGGSITGGAPTQGSGPKAQTTIGKAVLDNANAFKNMANMGTASLKGMTDALKTSFTEQHNQIRRLQEALGRLGQAYDKVGGSGKNAVAIQAKMIQVAGQISTGQGSLSQLQGLSPQLMPQIPWPGSKTAGGGAGGGKPPPPGALLTPLGPGDISGLGMAKWAMGGSLGAVAMRSAGLLAAGGTAVMNTSQAFNNMMMDTRASRGAAMRPAWERAHSVDISDALAERHLRSLSSQEQIEALRSVSSSEADFNRLKAGIGTTIKSMGAGAAALTPDQLGTEQAKDYQALLDKVKQRGDFYQDSGRGYRYMQESRGSRMTSAAMLGIGFYRNPKTGQMEHRGTDTLLNLHRSGYSVEELAGAKGQAQNIAGTQFAAANSGAIMGASRAGYDVSGLLGAAARSGSNARAALGGGIDAAAGIQLGQSLFGFDPRGTVTGMGALQAIQQGFQFGQGPQDFNTVERIKLGLGGADKLAAGFSGYQQGMNLVSAISAAPGASTYSQDTLAKMSFKELTEVASGRSSLNSRAFGITAEMAKDQMAGQMHGLFSPLIDQGTQDPASRALRAMRASGMGEQDFLYKLGEAGGARDKRGRPTQSALDAQSQLEALSGLAANQMGGGAEEAAGLLQLYSGARNLGKGKLKTGNLPFGGIDEAERETRRAEADVIEKDIASATQNMAAIIASLKDNKDRMAGLEHFTKFGASIDVLIEKFQKLAGVTDQVISRGGGSTTKSALGVFLSGPGPSTQLVKAVAPAVRSVFGASGGRR